MKINELYKAIKTGDGTGERELFDLLAVRFRLFAARKVSNREDAEEIVQESLLVISREYKELEIRTSFSSWAYQVLVNRIKGYYRDKQRDSRVESRPEVESGSRQIDAELESQLSDCLRKLHKRNSRYARILNLKYQGFTVDEICRKLDMTPNNLYVTLMRARAMLRKCLDKGELD